MRPTLSQLLLVHKWLVVLICSQCWIKQFAPCHGRTPESCHQYEMWTVTVEKLWHWTLQFCLVVAVMCGAICPVLGLVEVSVHWPIPSNTVQCPWYIHSSHQREHTSQVLFWSSWYSQQRTLQFQCCGTAANGWKHQGYLTLSIPTWLQIQRLTASHINGNTKTTCNQCATSVSEQQLIQIVRNRE